MNKKLSMNTLVRAYILTYFIWWDTGSIFLEDDLTLDGKYDVECCLIIFLM